MKEGDRDKLETKMEVLRVNLKKRMMKNEKKFNRESVTYVPNLSIISD